MKTLAAHGLTGGIVQDRMGGSFGAGFLAGSVGSSSLTFVFLFLLIIPTYAKVSTDILYLPKFSKKVDFTLSSW
jgi:hypothetical protein